MLMSRSIPGTSWFIDSFCTAHAQINCSVTSRNQRSLSIVKTTETTFDNRTEILARELQLYHIYTLFISAIINSYFVTWDDLDLDFFLGEENWTENEHIWTDRRIRKHWTYLMYMRNGLKCDRQIDGKIIFWPLTSQVVSFIS